MKKAILNFIVLSALLICTSQPLSSEVTIDEHGFWNGYEAIGEHKTDFCLAEALADFFIQEGVNTLVDLGCGTGDYVKVMRYCGIDCDGFDGNPETPIISDGVAGVADLSQPLDLGKKYDWVMSLEVGEHLPKAYEQTFFENLDRHNIHGIVLTWAVKGQGGFGHFNEQNNDYVKAIMATYGYKNDVEAENFLREQASLWWFKNSIMVFRR